MHRSDLERARINLARRYWAYAYMLSKFNFYKEVEGMGTIGVDQYWRVYWDPAIDWDDTEIETALLHEAGHAAGEHAERAKEANRRESFIGDASGLELDPGEEVNLMVWNIAGDLGINDDLERLDWVKFGYLSEEAKQHPEAVKGGWIFPTTLNLPVDSPLEWYYQQMRERAKAGQNLDGSQSDGTGCRIRGNGPQVPGQSDGSDGGKQPGPGSGKCGSVATGKQADWEDGYDEESCAGEAERKAAVEETERRVAEQIHGADTGGGKPPGTDALPPMLLDPDKVTAKVNHKLWLDRIQYELYHYLRHSHRSWIQPHRRIDGLPGKRRFPKQAVFICDISGSINSLSVQRTFEIMGRLHGRGMDIKIIVCDTQAHVVTDMEAVYSGGGTALGAGVELAREKFPNAGVIIVVTDGHTGWDCQPPRCPMVVFSWGLPGPQWSKSVPMPGLTEDELEKPIWDTQNAKQMAPQY